MGNRKYRNEYTKEELIAAIKLRNSEKYIKWYNEVLSKKIKTIEMYVSIVNSIGYDIRPTTLKTIYERLEFEFKESFLQELKMGVKQHFVYYDTFYSVYDLTSIINTFKCSIDNYDSHSDKSIIRNFYLNHYKKDVNKKDHNILYDYILESESNKIFKDLKEEIETLNENKQNNEYYTINKVVFNDFIEKVKMSLEPVNDKFRKNSKLENKNQELIKEIDLVRKDIEELRSSLVSIIKKMD
ncbi:hypothetical protein A0H76_807 [Hepatospora eriocheir]|uniref:Uncharacterized protein n=1 Tax=Hepatospora eriocheir TaxID=1081669 RepID=A0A1X0Q6U0_9MICR|nr:hypothetical protein A0H76_807 [Hepatospora eriocheir]